LETMVVKDQLLGTHQLGHSRIALAASPSSRQSVEAG
jgi:hypothetical protein